MSVETDHHYENMLLGLMPAWPCRLFLPCECSVEDTRHVFGIQKHPHQGDFRDVGRRYAKCVLCKAPLRYITPKLAQKDISLIKAYYSLRKSFLSTGASEAQKFWADRDPHDVDLGIPLEFYSSNRGPPLEVELRVVNFPYVSLWDCPVIKKKYNRITACFEVFNAAKDIWQRVSGDQTFDFVPFTRVIARTPGVDTAELADSIRASRVTFSNATTPPLVEHHSQGPESSPESTDVPAAPSTATAIADSLRPSSRGGRRARDFARPSGRPSSGTSSNRLTRFNPLARGTDQVSKRKKGTDENSAVIIP
ncbi:hypothetical protein AURDEDRAFT_177281 [Auricularia subglabra TFB-10046 SS5]|uniref:Uncharacterized protein n=1 Tax=Auricularia subglabra (strain TFB-10046 / SS5) TaxID=717982 RepID=J0CTJ8_AURST|nr:hypothetical protein AURDEDRAFT_177281 [Auricularia subglabra TFB-10046 SS5]